MPVHYEVFGAGPPLVMLHGWAMHGGVWRDFAMRLGQHYQVIVIDLPGHGLSGISTPFDLEYLSQALLQAIPVTEFTVLGWSMGATLALALVERCPERIKRVIVLSGNPCFIQLDDWPGMNAEVFGAFSALLDRGVSQTLTRFLALQVNGLEQGKVWLQDLKHALQTRPMPSEDTLRAGLRLLQHSDLRHAIQRAAIPICFILGDRDHLVPISLAQRVARDYPGISVFILEQAGHVAFLSHAERLLEILIGEL